MIEVNVTLMHEGEVQLFAEFTQILRQNRAAEKAPKLPTREEVKEAIDAQYGENKKPVEVVVETAVIANISPAGVVKNAVTDGALIEAFQKFAAGKSMPELVEVLKKYGATKVSEIAPEKRVEFLAEVTA
jgi:hypothetical protein